MLTVEPTPLRLNDDYVFWYNNLAKLLITGLAPFVLLSVFNFQVSPLSQLENVLTKNAN